MRDLPFIDRSHAKMLYDFIIKHNVQRVLELGFAHGVASCFIASALQEVNRRNRPGENPPKLTSIDLLSSRSRLSPSIEELLGLLGLQELVDVHWMQTGYHWLLHDEIRDQSVDDNRCRPEYDLIIFDADKLWSHLSSGFFLADKLLKPGGSMPWDDYHWTYSRADI